MPDFGMLDTPTLVPLLGKRMDPTFLDECVPRLSARFVSDPVRTRFDPLFAVTAFLADPPIFPVVVLLGVSLSALVVVDRGVVYGEELGAFDVVILGVTCLLF